MISTSVFPLKTVDKDLQHILIRSGLDPLDNSTQDEEEMASRNCLKLGALAFYIIKVVGKFVFVQPKSCAEPSKKVLKLRIRQIMLKQLSKYLQSSCSSTGVNVDFFHLLLDLLLLD